MPYILLFQIKAIKAVNVNSHFELSPHNSRSLVTFYTSGYVAWFFHLTIYISISAYFLMHYFFPLSLQYADFMGGDCWLVSSQVTLHIWKFSHNTSFYWNHIFYDFISFYAIHFGKLHQFWRQTEDTTISFLCVTPFQHLHSDQITPLHLYIYCTFALPVGS